METMKNIAINADVHCSDGSCGKTTNIIIDPVSRKVTHIVVEHQRLPGNNMRMVPVRRVKQASRFRIDLSCTSDDVAHMPPFLVTSYIQESPYGKSLDSSMTYFFPGPVGFRNTVYDSPYNVENTAFDKVVRENVPADELSLAAGMEIDASDGKVGKLDEIVLDPASGKITHLLMKKGPFWSRREVLLPVPSVVNIDNGAIHLGLDRKKVSEMPAVAIKR